MEPVDLGRGGTGADADPHRLRREAGDLSAGVFLPDGRMVAQAVTGTPGHVNSMAESVKHFLREYPPQQMFPGDVFLTNDPWKGTGHLNDLTMVTPVFKGRRMVALFASTVHVVDIGGIGLSADGTQIYHEGLFIPIIRLVSKGTIDETMLKVVRANVREPVQVEGDIYGLIACNEIGGRRLLAMMDEYRLSSIEALSEHIISRSKAAMLAAVREWPKGTWSYSMTTDGYDAPVVLVGTLTVSNRGIDIDFTGSSDVVGNGINVPKSYTDAYASFGVRCVIGPHIPDRCRRSASPRPRARSSTRRIRWRWRHAPPLARCCPTSCSAACARRRRTGCRPKAPRRCGTSGWPAGR